MLTIYYDVKKNFNNSADMFSSIIFFFQSFISLYLTILLNKIVISIFDDNISKKNFLYAITGICILASLISSVLFFIHSIPIHKFNIEENKKDFEEKKM